LPRRSSGLLSSDPSAHGRAPLAAAAARGHEPVVAALLGGAAARAATPAALVAAAAAGEAGCVAALARAAAPESGAAPARAAAARGHAAALEALAAEPATRAGLGAATADGETPAHLAARAGCAACLDVLARHAPDSLRAATADGASPFVYAALAGEARALDALARLDGGAAAAAGGALDAAVDAGSVAAVDAVLRLAAHDARATGRALVRASRLGETAVVDALVARHGADVEFVDEAMEWPLFAAAAWGRAGTVAALAALGGDVDRVVAWRRGGKAAKVAARSPAWAAARGGRLGALVALAEAGADLVGALEVGGEWRTWEVALVGDACHRVPRAARGPAGAKRALLRAIAADDVDALDAALADLETEEADKWAARRMRPFPLPKPDRRGVDGRVCAATPLLATCDAPLAAAADAGALAVVAALLERGARPGAVGRSEDEDRHLVGALDVAAERGDAALARLLLDAGAAVDSFQPARGAPIHAAAARGRLDVLDALLDVAPLSANLVFPRGGPAGGPPLAICARRRDRAAAAKLLDRGADSALAGPDGATAAVAAVLNNDVATLEALAARGADLGAGSRDGLGPPLLAAKLGYDRALRALAAGGADLGAAGPDGQSAASLAASHGKVHALQVLVEAGADLDGGPPDGRGGTLSPLLLAVRRRKLDCVLLLIRAGVEGLGDGAFLREALRAGDSDAAVALVKAGEDPELADSETGEWPLYVAAAKNLVRVLEALRAGGRADMARVGGDGGSLDPARAAAAAGHGDALRLLHVAGVDLRARAKVGDWTKLMRKKIKSAIRAGDLELHVLDDATVRAGKG